MRERKREREREREREGGYSKIGKCQIEMEEKQMKGMQKRERERKRAREVGREYNRVIEMEETVQLGRLGFRWV